MTDSIRTLSTLAHYISATPLQQVTLQPYRPFLSSSDIWSPTFAQNVHPPLPTLPLIGELILQRCPNHPFLRGFLRGFPEVCTVSLSQMFKSKFMMIFTNLVLQPCEHYWSASLELPGITIPTWSYPKAKDADPCLPWLSSPDKYTHLFLNNCEQGFYRYSPNS